MKLYIAEKHDVAKAIADVLGVTKRGEGHYICGEDKITWCAGHMLELCAPEDYDEKFKRWSLDHLPLVFIPWKYKVINGRAKQLKIIKDLLKEATTVVHAGDSDDEGQLLVDEILTYYKVKLPTRRLLINDNNPKIIKRALETMRDNKEFFGLYQSALARSVADQLYGFNMTRLYTLKAQANGSSGTLSVGRVQTPILGLIVNRDRLIRNHTKEFYYVVNGTFLFSGQSFIASHIPGDDAPVGDNNKISDRNYAENIKHKCVAHTTVVTKYSKGHENKQAPLPYDLLELQVDASRKFGLDPDVVLKITQSLRENHKLITYNRSDCRYLSEEQHADAPNVLAAIRKNANHLSAACDHADSNKKGRAFNSSNVTAHHAIVPTEAEKDIAELTENERKIYLLIARAYIAQFWPERTLEVTKVLLSCEGESFSASHTKVVAEGWKQLYTNDADNQEIDDEAADDNTAQIPPLSENDNGQCTSCSIAEKETAPAKHYTMATLLKDLKRVSKYVKDPAIKKLLIDKDKDKKGESGGIGTPATRDSFITKLREREFIVKKGVNLLATPLGESFYDALPQSATQPDLTALWHQQQKDIAAGISTVDAFLQELVRTIASHVTTVKGSELKPLAGSAQPEKKQAVTTSEFLCEQCGKQLIRRSRKQQSGDKSAPTYWYGCSGYPACKQTYNEANNKPTYTTTR